MLRSRGVGIHSRIDNIPAQPDLPAHTRALTCRASLPDVFPGYELYLWVDSDIRFLKSQAIATYLNFAAENPNGGVFALECDPSYVFMRDRINGFSNMSRRFTRLRRLLSEELSKLMALTPQYNAGVFAMSRHSRIWTPFRRWIQRSIEANAFQWLNDQDALNLAILEAAVPVTEVGSCMNWLCSLSMPRFDHERSVWTRPQYPFTEIQVLHLSQSGARSDGSDLTLADEYQRLGLF